MTNTAPPGAADATSEVIDVRLLRPWLTALVRWLLQGFGVWLVAHGVAQARADALLPILSGLLMSLAALAWSWGQKRLQALRLVRAARADPAKVVFR